jgi:hypothetical protein
MTFITEIKTMDVESEVMKIWHVSTSQNKSYFVILIPENMNRAKHFIERVIKYNKKGAINNNNHQCIYKGKSNTDMSPIKADPKQAGR